jgi:hypothetical protein
MQPGQKIEIQLVDTAGHRVRLRNVLPTITFFSGGHRHYVFDLRPTEADGQSRIGFDELETRRRELGLTHLMDYNTPLTTLDPSVEISIPSETHLQKRLQVMEEWNHWDRPSWVLKWPVNGCLAPVESKRVTLEGPLTHVDIVISLPTDIANSR